MLRRGRDVLDDARACINVADRQLHDNVIGPLRSKGEPFAVWLELDDEAALYSLGYVVGSLGSNMVRAVQASSVLRGRTRSGFDSRDMLTYYVGTYTDIDDTLLNNVAAALLHITEYFPDFKLIR